MNCECMALIINEQSLCTLEILTNADFGMWYMPRRGSVEIYYQRINIREQETLPIEYETSHVILHINLTVLTTPVKLD